MRKFNSAIIAERVGALKVYELEETQKIQHELHIEFLRTLIEDLMMSPSKSFSLESILPKTEGELATALETIQFTTTNDYSTFKAIAFGAISCLEFNINGNRWLLIGTSKLYFRQKDNNTNWYSVCEIRNTGVLFSNDESEMIIISKVFSGSLENQIIMSKNLNKAYENYRKSCL